MASRRRSSRSPCAQNTTAPTRPWSALCSQAPRLPTLQSLIWPRLGGTGACISSMSIRIAPRMSWSALSRPTLIRQRWTRPRLYPTLCATSRGVAGRPRAIDKGAQGGLDGPFSFFLVVAFGLFSFSAPQCLEFLAPLLHCVINTARRCMY
ncbi:unnamed protein product [Chondrus crispus]|uniref:Uncharacterized protein n=1 Tax=Chondrus crispus TaxID=2769 RepID=R7Q4H6_CHOCR|nr:unnamed protein product [Chondrus crispus]CDF32773.1 unnamed protein product [Chondrus crispus]|eukprot:XP_005712574.1 unnamed protein product [Chondrus crispus]